ncbi:MAG: lytic murein transglycosylase [Pseudomonadota bacterium]
MNVMSLNAARFGVGLIGLAAIVASCAATPQQTPFPTTPPISEPNPPSQPAPTVPSIPPFASSGDVRMDAWRDDYSARALASGRDPVVVYETLSEIRPLALYLSTDAKIAGTDVADQAEFAKPIWDYVGTAVTSSRKSRGAQKLNELGFVFDQIEAQYGVDREALTAIWAMETNLGSYIGDFDAANTLSNMAVEGRRKSFAEGELTALMKLQEKGEVNRDQLVSGWAGAMGQTQFMPSTFLAYAVDGDGDGRKDLWGSEADALASAANYLSVSGYQNNMPWGIEVLAPADFDWSLADGQDRRLSTWIGRGLSPLSGGGFNLGEGTFAELWLPSGATGPKYLLFKNFDVFKTYNRSDSYALSVGLLTDGVAGQSGPITPWPTQLQLLSNRDIMVLQSNLNRLGFDAGPVDGIAGRGTKGALRRFQAANGIQPADGFPTQQALQQVIAAAG